MKKADVKQGECYIARISGRLVTVRVDKIRLGWGRGGSDSQTYYDVTNLTTNRTTTFRSAAKFRKPAPRIEVGSPAPGDDGAPGEQPST